ncbi:MAG: hypothetical protein ACLFTE_08435, partial [Salinivenus sp.]
MLTGSARLLVGLTCLLFTSLLLGLPVTAQPEQDAESDGRLVGVVVDAQQGEPLPGANVTIEGTSMGTST